MWQWVIVRDNCETFVTWAETKEQALEEFHAKGHSDEWKVLKKRKAAEMHAVWACPSKGMFGADCPQCDRSIS